MLAGIIVIAVCIFLLLLVALLDRPSRPSKSGHRPILGWGNDTNLPRL